MSDVIFRLADVGELERKLKNSLGVLAEIKEDEDDEQLLQAIITELNDLKELPTITIKSLWPKAHWIQVEPNSDVEWKCSKCNSVISTDWDYHDEDMFNYCPCCGSKMTGEEK